MNKKITLAGAIPSTSSTLQSAECSSGGIAPPESTQIFQKKLIFMRVMSELFQQRTKGNTFQNNNIKTACCFAI